MLARRIPNTATTYIQRLLRPPPSLLRLQTRRYSAVPDDHTATTEVYKDVKPDPEDIVFLAMSGGIDSTISAHLLLTAGHPAANIIPFHMRNWAPEQHSSPHSPSTPRLGPYGKPLAAAATTTAPTPPPQQKCIDAEFRRVQSLCRYLDLHAPLSLSFEAPYWLDIFAPMLSSYAAGLTPNPDVSCNRHIKFGAPVYTRLSSLAPAGKRWWLATGHYARNTINTSTGERHLLRARDEKKDQTFFLATMNAAALERAYFPLGAVGWTKAQVHSLARELELPGWRDGEATQEESMGLCFVEPGRGFARFLDEYLPPQPGEIVADGEVVGKHQGLWHATVGEKAGVQMPQHEPRWRGRWYVASKDVKNNRIEVVRKGDARLRSYAMRVAEWNWLGRVPDEVARKDGLGVLRREGLWAKFRHMQQRLAVECVRVEKDAEGGAESVWIDFKHAQGAIAEGQVGVLWDGERCLGGGVIDEVRRGTVEEEKV